jgi:telomerase reverse transcriptase
VDEFVRLRRHDRYSVHSAMSGLRLRDMTWLRGVRRDYKDKQRMVQRLLSWVYAQLIIPLLRIHFYVTESGQYGYVRRW